MNWHGTRTSVVNWPFRRSTMQAAKTTAGGRYLWNSAVRGGGCSVSAHWRTEVFGGFTRRFGAEVMEPSIATEHRLSEITIQSPGGPWLRRRCRSRRSVHIARFGKHCADPPVNRRSDRPLRGQFKRSRANLRRRRTGARHPHDKTPDRSRICDCRGRQTYQRKSTTIKGRGCSSAPRPSCFF